MSAYLKTVLVVDDKEWIRIAISLVLEEFGYSLRSADDGRSALHEIHLQNADILVSDLTPGMAGFELLINVRRLFPAIKVIAMSGSFSGNEVPPGVLADAYYPKGRSVSTLLQAFRTLPHMKDRLVESATTLESQVLLAYERP